jgi:hypothetical protein
MAEDYGNGKDFSPEHMRKVTDDAAYAANANVAHAYAYAYYAYYAAAAAANVAAHAYAARAHAAYYAAYHAAYYSSNAHAAANYYKPLLFDLIESRLSKLEKILIFG